MKSKTKKDFKLAEKFLLDLQKSSAEEFQQLNKLLIKYDLKEIDKNDLYQFLLRIMKIRTSMLPQFNSLLNQDKRVLVVPPQRVKQMFEFILLELSNVWGQSPKFQIFIDCFGLIIQNKFDKVCFTSYQELIELTISEIEGSQEIWNLGSDFVNSLRSIMEVYHASIMAEPLELVEPVPPTQFEVEKEIKEPVVEQPKPVTTSMPKKAKPKSIQSNGNGSHVNPPPISAPVEEVFVPQSTTPNIIPTPEPMQIEPGIIENLKLEDQVFAAIRRKVSASDFDCLIKNLYLYYKNVISYFELIKISESILFNLEKDICVAFRDILESREQTRTRYNPFNIKINFESTGYPNENRSYKKILCKELNNLDSSDTLINKTFFATAHGNEAAVNVDDGTAKKTVKNLSEETLYRVEDELHEFDSIIQQFKMSLVWIERLKNPNTSKEQVAQLCNKLNHIRSIHAIYGTKSSQVLDELPNRSPDLINLVKKRVEERLEMLKEAYNGYTERQWKPTLEQCFYKALDSRSSSIKFAEKTYLANKNFINRLKEFKQSTHVPFLDSLGYLIGHESEKTIELVCPETENLNFWSPTVCFRMENKDIMSDILGFLRIYIRLSKMNLSDKEKSNQFIQKVLFMFLDIPQKSSFIDTVVTNDNELNAKVFEYEHAIYKHKEFFYSDKIRIKFIGDDNSFPSNYIFKNKNEEKETVTAQVSQRNSPRYDGNDKSAADNNSEAENDQSNHKESNQYDSEFEQLLLSESSIKEYPKETVFEVESQSKMRRRFYSSYQFYLTYQYFILLYERFEFVYNFSVKSTGSIEIYQLFKQLLMMTLDEPKVHSQFEDCMRTLFNFQSGVLLNLDRIMHNCVKHIPNEEFISFVFSVNSDIFNEGGSVDSAGFNEEVIFAKTCHKFNEMILQNNKNYKSNSLIAFNNNFSISNNELLKFDFDAEQSLLIIHRVKSIYQHDPKTSVVSPSAMIEDNYGLMSKPVQLYPKTKQASQCKRTVVNKIAYSLHHKTGELSFYQGHSEDFVFNLQLRPAADPRKKKISKLQKIRNFREKRALLFRDVVNAPSPY